MQTRTSTLNVKFRNRFCELLEGLSLLSWPRGRSVEKASQGSFASQDLDAVRPAACLAALAPRTAVFPLKIPEVSVEALDESGICRWSLEVWPQIRIRCFFSRNRDPGVVSTKMPIGLSSALCPLDQDCHRRAHEELWCSRDRCLPDRNKKVLPSRPVPIPEVAGGSARSVLRAGMRPLPEVRKLRPPAQRNGRTTGSRRQLLLASEEHVFAKSSDLCAQRRPRWARSEVLPRRHGHGQRGAGPRRSRRLLHRS